MQQSLREAQPDHAAARCFYPCMNWLIIGSNTRSLRHPLWEGRGVGTHAGTCSSACHGSCTTTYSRTCTEVERSTGDLFLLVPLDHLHRDA
jgi:hypothetical protein